MFNGYGERCLDVAVLWWVLRAGDMECLQELCGTVTDTTVFTTDGRQVEKRLQKSYIGLCKNCYSELERIVKLRAQQ